MAFLQKVLKQQLKIKSPNFYILILHSKFFILHFSFPMLISLIAAAAENNAIGKDNKMLWRLPNDLKYFKNITWGLPVLMGRKTFDSFGGGKPLPGRANIILTRKKDYHPEGVVVVNSLDNAFFFVNANDFNELMVIGGGELYNMMLPKADTIYLTRVHHSFTDADAFFPSIDEKKWERKSVQDFAADDKHQYAYSFEVWKKR